MNIIQEVKGKIKWLGRKAGEPDIFTALIVILVAFLSFGLGRLSVVSSKKSDIWLETIPLGEAGAVSATAVFAVPNKSPATTHPTQRPVCRLKKRHEILSPVVLRRDAHQRRK